MTINGKDYAFDEKGILLLGFEKNREVVDRTQPSNPTVKKIMMMRQTIGIL